MIFCLLFLLVQCDSDNSSSFREEDIFEAEFEVAKKEFKTGKRKGEAKTHVTLIFGPYVFRKKSERKGLYNFVCKACEDLGKNLIAKAESEDGENFSLVFMPDLSR